VACGRCDLPIQLISLRNNQTKGEQSYITFPGLVSTKIDVWLNGQANDPVFKWCLNDLKINLSDKSYSKDNRLNMLDSSH